MSVIRTVLRARVFLLSKAYGVASQKLSERSKRDEPVLQIYLSLMNTPQRFLTVKTKAIIVQLPYGRGVDRNSESGDRDAAQHILVNRLQTKVFRRISYSR